jgi:hypothetical protein
MKKFISLLLIAVLCFVSVPGTASAAIKINRKKATVIEGDYLYLKITGTNKKVTWTSSNEYKASVSKKGKVTTKDTGNVNITAKVGTKKYTCKVIIVPNFDPDYMTDKDLENAIAERDYIDNFSEPLPAQDINIKYDIIGEDTTESDAELDDKISNLLKTGFASSEDLDSKLGKTYLEFCETWISQSELELLGISVVQSISGDNKLYLIPSSGDNYILYGSPTNPISGTILSSDNVEFQYLEKFECSYGSYDVKQYFFNKEDLKNKGIIK